MSESPTPKTDAKWLLAITDGRDAALLMTTHARDQERTIARLIEDRDNLARGWNKASEAITELVEALKFIATQVSEPGNAHHTLGDYRHGAGISNAWKLIDKHGAKS